MGRDLCVSWWVMVLVNMYNPFCNKLPDSATVTPYIHLDGFKFLESSNFSSFSQGNSSEFWHSIKSACLSFQHTFPYTWYLHPRLHPLSKNSSTTKPKATQSRDHSRQSEHHVPLSLPPHSSRRQPSRSLRLRYQGEEDTADGDVLPCATTTTTTTTTISSPAFTSTSKFSTA